MRNVFKNLFPIIYEVYKKIKELDVNSKHKLFSQLVLQKESYLVLDVVCKEFKEKHKDCKLITLHDCIITTSEFKDELQEFMETRISEILKIKINTKQKCLSCLPSIDIAS